MPTLEPIEEPPTRTERVAVAAKRVSATIGAVRSLVCLALAVVGASMAPSPWAQIALLGLLGLAVDIGLARRVRYAVPMQGKRENQ